MKSKLFKLCAGAMLVFLLAGTVEKAEAQVVVVPAAGNVQVMYDSRGIPIWGYGTRGRAIYAYSPEGLPVYAYERVYSGCYVPTWDPLPRYRGPWWPRGIHRVRHYKPHHHVHHGPRPPHHAGHGPGPRPPHHAGPGHGPGRPGPGGHGPGGHGPGGHGPGGPRR